MRRFGSVEVLRARTSPCRAGTRPTAPATPATAAAPAARSSSTTTTRRRNPSAAAIRGGAPRRRRCRTTRRWRRGSAAAARRRASRRSCPPAARPPTVPAASSEPPAMLPRRRHALRVATSRPLGHPADGRPAFRRRLRRPRRTPRRPSTGRGASRTFGTASARSRSPSESWWRQTSLRASAMSALPATALAAQANGPRAARGGGERRPTILEAVLGAFGAAGGASRHTAEARRSGVVLTAPESRSTPTRFARRLRRHRRPLRPARGWRRAERRRAPQRLELADDGVRRADGARRRRRRPRAPRCAALPHILSLPVAPRARRRQRAVTRGAHLGVPHRPRRSARPGRRRRRQTERSRARWRRRRRSPPSPTTSAAPRTRAAARAPSSA